MILLAILTTLGAIVWSVLTVFANMMSGAPSQRFRGAWGIGLVWIIAAALWAAWFIG